MNTYGTYLARLARFNPYRDQTPLPDGSVLTLSPRGHEIRKPKDDRFYTYLIWDPRPDSREPIYVGKGRRNRAHSHLKKSSNPLLRRVIAKIRSDGFQPYIEIDSYFDTSAKALHAEIGLIARYGRRDLGTGSLCNLTDGGESPAGSLAHAEMMRRRNSDPAHLERARQNLRRLQADPAFWDRVSQSRDDPIRRKANSDHLRRLNADPAHREQARKDLRRLRADPEFNARRLAALRKAVAAKKRAKNKRDLAALFGK